MDRKEKEKKLRMNYIIETAKEVFKNKGYANTTTDEIAVAAEYTKRTLYRYFEAKEDIYFAVALKIYEELMSDVFAGVMIEGTGWEKIYEGSKRYVNFFFNKFDSYLILSNVRNINTREEESIYHQGIIECQRKMFELFMKQIMLGQNDGSIKKDLNPMMATHFMIASFISLFGEIAQSKEKLEKHLPYSIESFINYSVEMHMLLLKNS